MSDLLAFGLGWASGFIGSAIVLGTAWMRFGRMTAIAAAYDGAILAALRSSLRPDSGKPLLAGRPASRKFPPPPLYWRPRAEAGE